MRLYLLRHGEAESRARSDAERRLTALGTAEVRAVAAAAAARLAGLQLVASSPYQRARQTAAELLRTLGFAGELVMVPELTPAGRLHEVGAFVESCAAGELLLVSHQPLVGELLRELTDDDAAEPMATAHLAALELTAFARGGARLLWRLRPPR
ncbi:MAG: phosphohistidine phosphatase SixA [Pseudomonadota bacterium]|jgi:phosphohistidine phosphatase